MANKREARLAVADNLLIYATVRSLQGIISVVLSIELRVSLGAVTDTG
ncbi:MAG: hypothetical protein HN900_01380 [Gammaproteobacteria bacterium]|nr:hypothetical protein [Gammaproteobacteria bacterium]MBT6951441.1 hypothetical protein [Gammaproteobacteria bacterium]MBT7173312.1 hypothetical protein [Gammaproteobacteria bacterium]MBT7533802.1 hypothetical protein [Gammaproteobacteria bacterium]